MRHRLVRFGGTACALALGATLAGCDAAKARTLHTTLASLGVEDPPAKPPINFQVLCDRSIGSPCEHGLAMQTVERVLREATARPLSRVEVFTQGDEVAETRLIASVTIPTRTDRGERAARTAEERFLQNVRPVLCLPLGAELTRPRTRRSPILESLDKLALTRAATLPVEVFAISDLREVSSIADMECDALPSSEQLQARLRRRNVLAPGTYAPHTRVHFIVGDGGPVPRRDCPITMGRVRAIQSLFRGALTAAGALGVTFHTEAPDVAEILAAPFAPLPVTDAGTTAGRTR